MSGSFGVIAFAIVMERSPSRLTVEVYFRTRKEIWSYYTIIGGYLLFSETRAAPQTRPQTTNLYEDNKYVSPVSDFSFHVLHQSMFIICGNSTPMTVYTVSLWLIIEPTVLDFEGRDYVLNIYSRSKSTGQNNCITVTRDEFQMCSPTSNTHLCLSL